MTTTCRSDVVLGCAAVILTFTAASPGACQRLADSTTHGAVDVRTTPPPREHTVPTASAGKIDARFQGRTVFYRPRPDSIVAPVRPAPPDSSSR
jgi:hypothetical protein